MHIPINSLPPLSLKAMVIEFAFLFIWYEIYFMLTPWSFRTSHCVALQSEIHFFFTLDTHNWVYDQLHYVTLPCGCDIGVLGTQGQALRLGESVYVCIHASSLSFTFFSLATSHCHITMLLQQFLNCFWTIRLLFTFQLNQNLTTLVTDSESVSV